MTKAELKEIISKSADQNWYNTVEQTFNFPYINYNQTFTGLSAIYEFVTQQVTGFEKYGEILPSELQSSKNYFVNFRDIIIEFMNSHGSPDRSNLAHYWNNFRQRIENLGPNQPLLYQLPETKFLINLNKEHPEYIQGAINFIKGARVDNMLHDKNFFIGSLLAYEITLKKRTQLPERREAEKESFQDYQEDYKVYITESERLLNEHYNLIRAKTEEYSGFVDRLKKDKEEFFESWFKGAKGGYEQFIKASNSQIKELENNYGEVLRLKLPAEYWKTRSAELKQEGNAFLRWLIGLVLFACLALYLLLWLTPEGMLKTFFGNDKTAALRWTILFITFISFLVYGIRMLAKVMLSAYHLARDAEERERLTYVYLAMIKDSSIEKEDRHLVMQSLFSRADSGLLKDDSSPTMPGGGNLIDKIFSK